MTPTDSPAQTGSPAFTAARSHAVRRLRGQVLEIGAGRGANFGDLDADVAWVGLEPSRRLRAQLTHTAGRHEHRAPPIAAAAEEIPLPDASVNAVLATTVLCSVRAPEQVLAEVARVLVPGGRMVLAEHVIAAPGTFTRSAQHLARPLTRLLDHGCDPTRDTELAVENSSLRVESVSRHRVPVIGRLAVPFVIIEAAKP